jgi:hypothetical protein
MSLSALDKIKLKTKEILIKTDDYLRKPEYEGITATQKGLLFGATSVVAGIFGVAAIVAAPTLPALAGVAAIASIPSIAIGGATINLAGATLLGGSVAGITFSALTKLYANIKGERNDYICGELECFVKNGNPYNEEVIRVNRKQVLKDIENGTFSQKYDGIRVRNSGSPTGYISYRLPEKNPLEVISSLPYLFGEKQITPKKEEWLSVVKQVRRECFKEAKDFNIKASIANRISEFREKFEGRTSTRKFNI